MVAVGIVVVVSDEISIGCAIRIRNLKKNFGET
jgi:hypothetical protein